QERAGQEIVDARRDVGDRLGRLGQRDRLVGVPRQQEDGGAREDGVRAQRRLAQHTVEDGGGLLGGGRPVERGGQRQGAPGQDAAVLAEGRVGPQRPRLVDQLVDLVVDDA